jgi:hypothetical protein
MQQDELKMQFLTSQRFNTVHCHLTPVFCLHEHRRYEQSIYLAISKEQSRSQDSTGRSDGYEIPCSLWNRTHVIISMKFPAHYGTVLT